MQNLDIVMAPVIAKSIGIRKLKLIDVNSAVSTIAVIGIFWDAARKAAAPTMAKAPKWVPGKGKLQIPPSTTARRTPLAREGVSKPPSAPALKVDHTIIIRNTNRIAANWTPMTSVNPS